MENAPALLEQTERAIERLKPPDMTEMIRMLTFLPQYAVASRAADAPRRPINFASNEEMWSEFHNRQLPDTTRLRLEHFHLFEWFPLSPGKFHTEEGQNLRGEARYGLQRDAQGIYYDPYGKANMIKGGIGAVKLISRPLANEFGQRESHFLMTASSNGVCHEGVPVLIPRRQYTHLIDRIRDEGAVPVNVEGEMKPLPGDARSFFGQWRLSKIPHLVVNVDRVEELPMPRPNVTRYTVAIALSFFGTFQEQQGVYMSYCTFDPASQANREQRIDWLKRYVQNYQGFAITDFDEEFPEFRNAPFALRRIMNGELDALAVQEVMNELGYSYFGNSEESVQQAVNEHNHYYLNIVGPRGVQVHGDVGGSIIAGDDNEVAGTEPQ